MSASAQLPPPATEAGPSAAEPADGARTWTSRPSRRGTSTPDRLRRVSWVVAGVCLVAGLFGLGTAASFQEAVETVRDNTGPVLVEAQSLSASLAEADAASTAAFLSGIDEDPLARRSYLEALERAVSRVEQVSGLIGDDDAAHEALQDLGTSITRYAALVEAARATNLAGLSTEGEAYLLQAVALLDGDVADATARLEQAALDGILADSERLREGLGLGRWLLLGALAALVAAQLNLAQRTRRILNLPLVLATLTVLGALGWATWGVDRAVRDFDDARFLGFDAIEASADIQRAAFAAKGAETVALITRASTARVQADQFLDDAAAFRDLPADTEREAARVAEADVRFSRYVDAVVQVRGATSTQEIVDLVVGPFSQAFNGFTFQLEGILADNRDQFLDGLDRAAGRTAALPFGLLVLPWAAAGLALVGFQRRIGEYR